MYSKHTFYRLYAQEGLGLCHEGFLMLVCIKKLL
jgi:hypothetical protein